MTKTTTKAVIINDKSISKFKPHDKEYYAPVADHAGLFLRVYPNGNQVWIYRYTPKGTKTPKKITIGHYPAVTLSLAKEKWAVYHNLRHQGIDPQIYQQEQNRNAQKQAKNKFNLVCHDWANIQEWKPNSRKRRMQSLDLLCRYLGDKPINTISTSELVDILKDIESKHRQRKDPTMPSDKAARCRGFLIDIFAWATLQGFCDTNPAEPIKNTKTEYTAKNANYGNRPAITEPLAFGVMLAKLDKANITPPTYHNLKLLAYLAVRNCDIRQMQWADIDFDKALWTFSPIKGDSHSKIKMVQKMSVPLPRQALAILNAQYKFTGTKDNVFDNGKGGVISDNTAGKALNKLGYQDVHCPHGFRATAKSLLMSELDYNHIITEMVLGHLVHTGNKGEDPYLRADLLNQRTELMQVWADYIDDLTAQKETTKYKGLYRQDPKDILQVLLSVMGKDEILKALGV